jgi:hypothetical protein
MENDFENNVVHCFSVDQIIIEEAVKINKSGIIFQTDLTSFAARSAWTKFCTSIISKYGERPGRLMCAAIINDNVMFFNSEAELADFLKEMRLFDLKNEGISYWVVSPEHGIFPANE